MSPATNYGFNGTGQTVAVIDSGIAWNHFALGGGLGAQLPRGRRLGLHRRERLQSVRRRPRRLARHARGGHHRQQRRRATRAWRRASTSSACASSTTRAPATSVGSRMALALGSQQSQRVREPDHRGQLVAGHDLERGDDPLLGDAGRRVRPAEGGRHFHLRLRRQQLRQLQHAGAQLPGRQPERRAGDEHRRRRRPELLQPAA